MLQIAKAVAGFMRIGGEVQASGDRSTVKGRVSHGLTIVNDTAAMLEAGKAAAGDVKKAGIVENFESALTQRLLADTANRKGREEVDQLVGSITDARDRS
jgi:hypothetical protein